MAANAPPSRTVPASIAPAPALALAVNVNRPGNPGQLMPYTCQACAKRKVKCDKTTPACSTCRKGKLDCVYQAPAPRRKRKLSGGDVLDKLARYEGILRRHGLLGDAGDDPVDAFLPSAKGRAPESRSRTTQDEGHNTRNHEEMVSLRLSVAGISRVGKLLAGQGKSRYIDNNIWRNFGAEELQSVSDDEEQEDDHRLEIDAVTAGDPLTAAFLGSSHINLLSYHPTHTRAMVLWKIHLESVEPLCKTLHGPSVTALVEKASQHPEKVSRGQECILLAVYHFAVFSMTDKECIEKLYLSASESRALLLQQFNYATRQALVNASFLKTTEMSVLQALVIFLLSCRNNYYDAHTYWVLTGVALRIAQRMGLHRDGEKLGLSPFEVQMRRLLFYQLLPLDGIASQMSGTGITMMPDTWDTQPPLNIDDDQIWPGMTEMPKEKQGATDMIFCLSRACLGKYASGSSAVKKDGATSSNTAPSFFTSSASSGLYKCHDEAEEMIAQAEREVEERFLRYCDVILPLHYLTMCSARCGITAMRLKIRLPRIMNRDYTPTDSERKEVFQLAQKVLDTDANICAHPGLKRFGWHVRFFTLWGTWDSLIFVLTSLCRKSKDGEPMLSAPETDAAWNSVEQLYRNHEEILVSKRALYVALGRLTVKAWVTNQARLSRTNGDNIGNTSIEPDFITALRSLWERKRPVQQSRTALQENNHLNVASVLNSGTAFSPETPSTDINSFGLGNPGDVEFDFTNSCEFDVDVADWDFWSQLMNDR